MPTYDYECSKCGGTFELFQSMKDDPIKDCKLCGAKRDVKRLIGVGGGVLFKGTGFYQTDYKKSGVAPAAKTEKSDSASTSTSSPAPAKAETKPSGGCGGGCACH